MDELDQLLSQLSDDDIQSLLSDTGPAIAPQAQPSPDTSYRGLPPFLPPGEVPESIGKYIPSYEEMGQSLAQVPGDIWSAISGVAGAVRHPIDTIQNATATGVLDTIGHGAAMTAGALMTGPAAPLGAAAGDFLYNQVSQAVGNHPDTPLRQDIANIPRAAVDNAIVMKGADMGAAGINRAYNKGATGFFGGPEGGIDAANKVATADFNNANASSGPHVNFMTEKPTTQVEAQLAEASPFVEESQFYKGSNLSTDPASAEFGKFTGPPIGSATEAGDVLRSELPKVIESRDAGLAQYTNALQAIKDIHPDAAKGITFQDVMETPGKSGATLSSDLENLAKAQNATGLGGDTAKIIEEAQRKVLGDFGYQGPGQGVVTQGAMPLTPDQFTTKQFTPSEGAQVLSKIDARLEELKAFDADPRLAGPAAIERQALWAIRGGWKNAINRNLQAIEGAAKQIPGISLPPSGAVQHLNDLYHNLKPISEQLDTFQTRFDNAQSPMGEQFPSLSSQKPASLTQMVNETGAKILNEASGVPSQEGQHAIALNRANEEAFGRARRDATLREQSGPNLQPRSNISGTPAGATAALAVTATTDKKTELAKAIIAKTPTVQAPSFVDGQKQDLNTPPKRVGSASIDPKSADMVNFSNPKTGFTIPRDVTNIDPQGVAGIILGMGPLATMAPLMFQWKRVVAAGDKISMAQFLSEFSKAFPDFALSTGPVTGLHSEFNLGDGEARLVDPADRGTWEDRINMSSLRTDEKANRVAVLRSHWIAKPLNYRAIPIVEQSNDPVNAALSRLKATHDFAPREQAAMGSRKVQE